MRKSMKAVVTGVCLLGFTGLIGCSEDEVLECCMLQQLASHCDTGSSSAELQQAVRDWREVGDSGDGDACKAMINSEEAGCVGPIANYDEQDAIVDCK